jgi:hypothetical protein
MGSAIRSPGCSSRTFNHAKGSTTIVCVTGIGTLWQSDKPEYSQRWQELVDRLQAENHVSG